MFTSSRIICCSYIPAVKLYTDVSPPPGSADMMSAQAGAKNTAGTVGLFSGEDVCLYKSSRVYVTYINHSSYDCA